MPSLTYFMPGTFVGEVPLDSATNVITELVIGAPFTYTSTTITHTGGAQNQYPGWTAVYHAVTTFTAQTYPGNTLIDMNGNIDYVDIFDAQGHLVARIDDFPAGVSPWQLNMGYLYSTSYVDTFIGSSGDDFIHPFGGGAYIEGGAGNDELHGALYYDDFIDGGDGADIIAGEGGDDTLVVGAGDKVTGGDGDDYIAYADVFGATDIDGGSGVNIVEFTHALSGVEVYLGDLATAGRLTIRNAAFVAASPFDDIVHGSAASELLAGLSGDDVIYAGGGDDLIDGGPGNDTIDGGSGVDEIDYSAATNGVTINLGVTTAQNTGFGWDTLSQIENLDGTDFADTFTGDGAANQFMGMAGSDILSGMGGIDTLYGGDGNDILRGGAGADVLYGDLGSDTADYSNASGGVTVFLGSNYLNTGDAAGDVYASIENLSGSAYADILGGDDSSNTISGNDGSDWLAGSGGADTLQGGNGSDVLEGGGGGDALDGGADADVASYRNSAAGIVLDLTNSANNTGDAAGDTLANIENLWGTAFNDTIRSNIAGGGQVYGFEGNDTLAGATGNDVFYGGAGTDTMTGGAGSDDFFYLSWVDHVNIYGTPEPYEGGDTITDFTHGTDHIIVSRYWFGFGNIGGPAAALTSVYADFVTSGTATSSKPTFLWNNATKVLEFDPDGTGAGTKVTIATLTGATLTLDDIWTA